MFRFFQKKHSTTYDFEALYQSPLRTQFFYRTALWKWHDARRLAVWPAAPSDPPHLLLQWQHIIFIEARGDQTIEEFLKTQIQEKFTPAEVPNNFLLQRLNDIQNLVDQNILALSPTPVKVPWHFALPRSAS